MRQLSDPTIVNPSFVADLGGTYIIELVVNDGTDDSPPDDTVVVTVPQNTAPVADAGPDQSRLVGDLVTLDGSASTDVDGDPLTYFWTLSSVPAGSGATLSDATAVMPQFSIDLPGTYVAELVVDDGLAGSLPDSVQITTANSQPVADAGPDQSVPLFGAAVLDGSASFDADGDVLTYAWSLISAPAGSTAVLSDGTTVSPSVVTDVAGTYVVQLVVNDGTEDSAPDTVSISTSNTQPVANAGLNQTVSEGDTVFLDGSGSTDADGDSLTFDWSFTSRPAGSAATLSDSTDIAPSFPADEAGLFVVQLIVNDGLQDSDPDTTTITVEVVPNNEPVANDDSATVDEDSSVDIDVLANDTDDDGDSLSIDSFGTATNGAVTTNLAGGLTYTPNADFNGVDAFTYTISDGTDSDSATVTITVDPVNDAPVLDAIGSRTVQQESLLTFTATASDVDLDTLTFSLDAGAPVGAAIDPASGLFSWTPTATQGPGDFPITVRVTDNGSPVLDDSETITVTVTDVPNTAPVVDAGPDGSINEGASFASGGSFADPDNDVWTATVDYGDGSGPQALALNVDKTFVLSHVYADNGTFVVTVSVADDAGDSGTDTATVTVANVDPSVDAGPDQTIVEGDTFTGGGSFVDPGDDTWTATVDYGEGAGPEALALATDRTFALSNDYQAAGTYTVTVTVTDDDGGAGLDSLTVTVAALPIVTIVTTDADASEATLDPGEMTLSRTGDTTNSLDVNLIFFGSTTNGTDYQTVPSPFTIPAGQASVAIPIVPIDDTDVEGQQDVDIGVVAGTGYVVGTPSVANVVIDDDDVPILTIVATDPAAAEAGPDAGTFTVTRTGPTDNPLIFVVQFDGTATRIVDYPDLQSGRVIPVGQSSVDIVITPSQDNQAEGDETIIGTLQPRANYDIGTPGSATITITDDPAIVNVVATDGDADEAGPDSGLLTFTRSGGDLSVSLRVQIVFGGAATVGADYGPFPGGFLFPAGQATLEIPITPNADNNVEGLEDAIFTIDTSVNYVVGSNASATVNIVDDPAILTIVATDPDASEIGPDDGVFTISRTGGDLTSGFIVNLTIGGTATEIADYQNIQPNFIFPANETDAFRRDYAGG